MMIRVPESGSLHKMITDMIAPEVAKFKAEEQDKMLADIDSLIGSFDTGHSATRKARESFSGVAIQNQGPHHGKMLHTQVSCTSAAIELFVRAELSVACSVCIP
jgi:hypothetical protein